MPNNKQAAVRYRLIDQALQRRHKQWTFQALLDHINEQLQEYFGPRAGISKRTLESDFKDMRSDPPLGFNAPILYRDKIVKYDDPDFTIERYPLSASDIKQLTLAMSVLRQFPELDVHGAVHQIITKIKSRALPNAPELTPDFIHFEKNQLLKGLHLLPDLYRYVQEKARLQIQYQPFDQPASTFEFHPYLLKAYNNRWFVIGFQETQKKLWNLSLDRIQRVHPVVGTFRPNIYFDPASYFDKIIGVTLPEDDELTEIELEADNTLVPYLITKPLHNSQVLVSQNHKTSLLTLQIIPNYEFYAIVSSHLPRLIVIKPLSVRRKMEDLVREAYAKYTAKSD